MNRPPGTHPCYFSLFESAKDQSWVKASKGGSRKSRSLYRAIDIENGNLVTGRLSGLLTVVESIAFPALAIETRQGEGDMRRWI
jgi:hypothetical protein